MIPQFSPFLNDDSATQPELELGELELFSVVIMNSFLFLYCKNESLNLSSLIEGIDFTSITYLRES